MLSTIAILKLLGGIAGEHDEVCNGTPFWAG
jgi:hypothetical protein